MPLGQQAKGDYPQAGPSILAYMGAEARSQNWAMVSKGAQALELGEDLDNSERSEPRPTG